MFRMLPVLNVVVFVEPGPPDGRLESESIEFVMRESQWPLNGTVAYVVLRRASFLQIRSGVRAGDAIGTAAGILSVLGPQVAHMVGRPRDFIYGWNSKVWPNYGEVFLLQVFSRKYSVLKPQPLPAKRRSSTKVGGRAKRR